MKIHLLRHADTEGFTNAGGDKERNLLPEGKERALKMGAYLNENLSRKIAVYCSTSTRTRQTAALVQSKFEYRNIQFKEELYNASSSQIMNFVNGLEGHDAILIIGHNDGISDLTNLLTGDLIYLDTCQYVCIDLTATNWKEVSSDSGRLVDNYRPESI